MEIDAIHLLLYFTVWTIFYFFLSHYIAELSRKRWTNWVQSEDSDEILMEALEVIVNEIEDRMHEKLEQFQSSFLVRLEQLAKTRPGNRPINNQSFDKRQPNDGLCGRIPHEKGGFRPISEPKPPRKRVGKAKKKAKN